jgi:PBP1b-binding outer membrane lipoprotein LpoB
MKHVINTKISIFINNMMKKITLLITTIFLINACSQNEQEVDATSESFVEYVWHKSGT